jgi:ADP-ribosylglycohydrolase
MQQQTINSIEQIINKITNTKIIIDNIECKLFTNKYSAKKASIWCLLTTDNYSDAVLKSVNLGKDTDTTAAVTGGLAALLYGFDSIPNEWLNQLARKEDIEDLAKRMSEALS